jgi:hypothetical protein
MSEPTPVLCPDCVSRQANLGDPSHARWLGPDGGTYCSMHFVQKFGHAEPLVRIEGYIAPERAKTPAPKRGAK